MPLLCLKVYPYLSYFDHYCEFSPSKWLLSTKEWEEEWTDSIWGIYQKEAHKCLAVWGYEKENQAWGKEWVLPTAFLQHNSSDLQKPQKDLPGTDTYCCGRANVNDTASSLEEFSEWYLLSTPRLLVRRRTGIALGQDNPTPLSW